MPSTHLRDFRQEVYAASGLVFDPRYGIDDAQWIDAVDLTKTNRRCFIGDFIISGVIEVGIGVPRLILVGSKSGRGKKRATYYRVVCP
jgi:hypothetical protein